jgi:hypothetical protein
MPCWVLNINKTEQRSLYANLNNIWSRGINRNKDSPNKNETETGIKGNAMAIIHLLFKGPSLLITKRERNKHKYAFNDDIYVRRELPYTKNILLLEGA